VTSPITWAQADTDRWLAAADRRERTLAPILDLLLAAAALQPGERVLDVGCGTGPSTAAAARAVRPGGSVLGLDLAQELIEAARQRVREPEVDWLVADATTAPLPEAKFDAVISRFGVMFFADPEAAFANLARATRAGGRLAMVVWPRRTEVEQFTLPYETVRRALERARVAYEEPAADGGPFSLSDPDRVREILEGAGWSEATVDTRSVVVQISGPDVDVSQVARELLSIGHTGALVTDQPEAVRADAERDLVDALSQRVTSACLTLNATVRAVSARRG